MYGRKNDDSDYEDGYADSGVGGKRIKTRQYTDGRTTYDFGGMGGKVTYDRYGNETCNPDDRGPDSSPFSLRTS